MSSAALPVERSYLVKAWFAVAAIVVIAATVITLAFATSGSGSTTSPRNGPAVTDVGVQDPNRPIVVNGSVCQQCR